MDISRKECARARESVSAGLDGELDELESRRLRAHLRACADCSTWSDLVNATTTQLREVPLEAPAALVELPRRGRAWRTGQAVAVAPALALIAGVVASLAGHHGSIGGRPATSTSLSRDRHHVVHNGPILGINQPAPNQHWVFRAV